MDQTGVTAETRKVRSLWLSEFGVVNEQPCAAMLTAADANHRLLKMVHSCRSRRCHSDFSGMTLGRRQFALCVHVSKIRLYTSRVQAPIIRSSES